MSNSSGYAIVEFSKMELARAASFMKALDPALFDAADYHGMQANGAHFGSEFEGGKIRRCHFTQCSFTDVSFIGTAGISSSFKECTLINFKIQNSCFDMSDFTQTQFNGEGTTVNISASSFSNTNLSYSSMKGIKCVGCSFENAYFKNSTIEGGGWQHCSFENANFENSKFVNVDLSNANIDYSVLKNVLFKNTKLPLVGILHSFDGLDSIEKCSDNLSFYFPSSSTELSFADITKQWDAIQAYFFSINDYFVLSSLNIYLGNHDIAYSYLELGLRHSLRYKDFRMIGYYCKLASLNHFFTKAQLGQLYENMKSSALINSMSGHEYRVFLFELDRMKRLLIDSPFGLPLMKISINTDIHPSESGSTAEMLNYIERSIEEYAPQASKHITLRHNSPLLFELFLSDPLASLYGFALTFSTALFGLTELISKLQNLVYDQHKISGIKLDNKLKALDLEKKKKELFETSGHECSEQANAVISPLRSVDRRVLSVSLSIQTDLELPKELRDVVIKK